MLIMAWFPYGRKHVVTVVEIDSFYLYDIYDTVTTHSRPYGNQAYVLSVTLLIYLTAGGGGGLMPLKPIS